MRLSERIFLLLLLAVGVLLFYGLFLFWAPQNRKPTPFIETIDPADFDDELPTRQTNLSTLRDYNYSGSFGGSSQEINSGTGNRVSLTEKAQELMNRGERISLSNEQRKTDIAEELIRLGFNDRDLIKLQTQACDDHDYRKSRTQIKGLLAMKKYESALSLIQENLDDTAEDNYLLRAEMLQYAAEIALMSGNLTEFERYAKEYFQNTEQVLNVYRNSSLNATHESREKIYQLSRELDGAKSGNFFKFLQSIQQKQISPREIIISAKANAAQNRHQADFEISHRDIEKSVGSVESMFQEWSHQELR